MKFIEIIYSFIKRHKSKIKKYIPIGILRKVNQLYVFVYKKKILKKQIEPFNRKINKDGINLIGAINAPTGLGQSCRLLENELKESKYNSSVINFDMEKIFNTDYNSLIEINKKKLIYNINIVNIEPYTTSFLLSKYGTDIFDYKYNIGFFLWELEEIPNSWVNIVNKYNEIWTPSEFCSESFRKKVNIPVKTIPYSMEVKVDKKCDRKYFNLPENKFLYLMMYDVNSITERKNPIAVINAFKKAFKKDNEMVGLVIKVNSSNSENILKLKKELEDYKNIYIITNTYSKVEVNSLIKCVDVIVSLHKAEGFGLVLAEAMMLKTPTIATNWSANTEFMNNEVACMVDYEFEILKHDVVNFKKGSRWAKPNINQAAYYMVKLFEDKKFYKNIQNKAYKYINEKLCIDNITHLINNRIKQIYKESDKKC